jgi:phosphoserine phosphatase
VRKTPAFASVVLDVDSTLCGVEGIDWLATQRGIDVAERVADLTRRAMTGEITLDSVYGERLAMVAPTRDAVVALSHAYAKELASGANHALYRIRESGVRIVLVSGGIREAILPIAAQLGVEEKDVHAVSLQFDAEGRYMRFDATSPLTTSAGKRNVVESCDLPRRILAVGDGITDLAMRPVVDAFAAFTGFVRRAEVADMADMTVESFDQLAELVLA